MSRRRFRPTDAFVDESVRGQRYLMSCVLVDVRHLPALRPTVEELAWFGGRVHFHNESKRRRGQILEAFAALPIQVDVVVVQRSHGVTEFAARHQCLTAIVQRLSAEKVSHLTLESRMDDRDDRRTIGQVRKTEPPLVFEHRPGAADPMLWVADGIAWAVGAGDIWRDLVQPVLRDELELP